MALGNVDLCVGDFWETTERRQLAPMSSSLDIDIFSLVAVSATVPRATAFFFSAIFMPFDEQVWIMCVRGREGGERDGTVVVG